MRSTLRIKYLKITILIILLCAIIKPTNTNAESQEQENNLVNIYFFHSKNCSYCNSELKFLDSIEKKYNNVNIYRFEVHDKINNDLRLEVQKLYDLKGNSVPLTIIGNTPYTGYSEELSNITFIKTIKYYSIYGYKDKVGELLKISPLPSYNMETNVPTLDEFIKIYGNYKLIGNLTTNDFDATSNAIFLGILTQLNPLKIISLIIMLILIILKKLPSTIIPLYLITSFLYNISNIFINSNNTTNGNIYILISIIIIINIIDYLKSYIKRKKIKTKTPPLKKKKTLYGLNIQSLIIVVISFLEEKYCISYKKAFKEIIVLYNLDGINKVNYYNNYIFMALIINIILILIHIYMYENKYKKQN